MKYPEMQAKADGMRLAESRAAAGPWQEGEPEDFKPGLYLVELQREEGPEMMAVKVYDVKEFARLDLLRYAEIYSPEVHA